MISMSNISSKATRLPVPDRQPREGEKAPYAGKEPPVPFEVLPVDTIVDGVDCSGMTLDPKKGDMPAFLQSQNRRGLTPEQKAKVDAAVKLLKDADKAKAKERKAMASQLGMAPTDMKKAGAKLKSEVKAKPTKTAKTKTVKPVKAKAEKATTKPVKVAKPRKDGEPRPGSKAALVGDLLRRKNGCTAAEAMKAAEWPSISMPAAAKAAGLKLRKEKKPGEVTRYYGS